MSIESFRDQQEKQGEQKQSVQEEGVQLQPQESKEDTPWGRLGITEEEFDRLYDDKEDPDAWLYQRR